MGNEVSCVADNPVTRANFARLLNADLAGWLPQTLAYRGPVVPKLGVEVEAGVLTRPRLAPAFDAGAEVLAVLKAAYGHLCTPELVRCNVEMTTQPVALAGHRPFAATTKDLTRMLGVAQTRASELDAVVGMWGTVPTWPMAAFSSARDGIQVPMQRYTDYVDRMPEWSLTLPGIHRPVVLSSDSVMGIGGCLAFQFSIDVPPGQLDRYYDAANIATALLRALNPGALFVDGQETSMEDSRWDIFKAATRVNGTDRTFLGPQWTHSPKEVFDSIVSQVHGRSIFLSATADKPGSAISQLLSSTFPAARPRFAPDGHVYLEMRVLSSGPTMAHQVAWAALGIGAIAWLADHIDEWRRELDFSVIQQNLTEAARGPQAKLTWRHDSQTVTATARAIGQWVMAHSERTLIDHFGVETADVEHALYPVRRLLETGVTTPYIQRQLHHHLLAEGMTHQQALVTGAQAYLRSAEYGASLLPVPDWNLSALAA